MYQKSDNALFRLELSSVKEQLIGLQAYKDGVDEYTEGVSKASKGAGKLQKGTNKLKNKTDDIMIEYFSFDLSNLTAVFESWQITAYWCCSRRSGDQQICRSGCRSHNYYIICLCDFCLCCAWY